MNQPINSAKDIVQYDFYLSGPMSGIKYYNFPAFDRVAEELRSEGHTVFNPAETFGSSSESYEDFLRIDTIAVARCRKIMMLPGWRKSNGACYEYLIAKTLGLEIEKYGLRKQDGGGAGEKRRIALLGYARAGKDTVGKALIDDGFTRVAIGDLIKSQVNPVIKAHLDHAAFTEDDDLKENIREVLVHFGYANYENILDEFLEYVPARAVNTRLYRYKEAVAWKELEGSELWLIERPGFGPKEPKVKEELDMIKEAGMVDRVIHNDGSISELRNKIGNHFNQGIAFPEVRATLTT